jgi:hypothetical protein
MGISEALPRMAAPRENGFSLANATDEESSGAIMPNVGLSIGNRQPKIGDPTQKPVESLAG